MESNNAPATAGGQTQGSGLVRAKRAIGSARERGVTPSDGGGTGRTDSND
ncbi:MAG TPA: hypothetical protein VN520_06925 [Streptomyces sp.]|nr:hypothetical protein [Streptomyces sp.]HWU06113.1 hypothetical protein [Streptomyces sp.]